MNWNLKLFIFEFHVDYDAEAGGRVLLNENDVESCVLLERVSNRKADSYLHYCGKDKPWNKNYRYRFGNIYRHYENICRRDMAEGYVPESQ